MAIPTEPLKLSVDVDALTMDDLELFEDFKVGRLKTFMAAHSNWTAAQIGALTVAEMRNTVAPAIAAALKGAAIPKGTATG